MESTPGRRAFIACLGFLVIVNAVQGSSFLAPISPLRCPYYNSATHECYTLKLVPSNYTGIVRNICPRNNTRQPRSFSMSIKGRGPCYSMHFSILKHFECQTSCCAGYYRDADGHCSRAFSHCFNGGTLLNHKCQCPQHFTGNQCDTAICTPTCQNGGICSANYGVRRCHCPSYVTGTFCQTPKCEQNCLNGGKCVLNFTSAVCLCPNGFTGIFCERALTPTLCLKTDVISGNNHCDNDGECETGEHCCSYDNKKGAVCTKPQYNCSRVGVVIRSGESHDFPDSCQTCTCHPPLMGDSDEGTLQCYTAGCSGPFVNNRHCCPTYGANRTCSPPRITNCPRYVSVTVNSYNVGKFDYRYEAKDCLGKPLKVHHTQYFSACKCYNRYQRDLIQTEPDFNNKVGQCSLIVKVRDVTPPVFESCPPDIYAYTDERVYWKSPEVRDNVGVRSVDLMSSTLKNGSVFSLPGVYILQYKAVDWQDNVRSCIFRVWTSDRESDNIPYQLKARKSTSTSNGVIIAGSVVGVLTVALILLIIIMVRFFRLRSKRLRQARERTMNRRSPGRTGNDRPDNVYSTDPPPYEIAAQDKLPAYSPKPTESPPVYDDIFTISKNQAGAHSNPIYDSVSAE